MTISEQPLGRYSLYALTPKFKQYKPSFVQKITLVKSGGMGKIVSDFRAAGLLWFDKHVKPPSQNDKSRRSE
jgi:hypothetical protein